METITISVKEPVGKINVRNAKWLRKRSGLVKKRNNRIRQVWLLMLRQGYTSQHIVAKLCNRYGIKEKTVYNAVNNYYR